MAAATVRRQGYTNINASAGHRGGVKEEKLAERAVRRQVELGQAKAVM